MSWVCGRFWGYNNEFVAPVFMGLKLEGGRGREDRGWLGGEERELMGQHLLV